MHLHFLLQVINIKVKEKGTAHLSWNTSAAGVRYSTALSAWVRESAIKVQVP